MDGWLKLHRSLSDHWIFSFKEPDKALAWIDLLIMARHTGGTVMMKGRALQLGRGQVGVSQLALQKKWGWSQNKVKRFLVMLKKHAMIDYETNDLTTVVTICNFESFQGDERASERPNERSDERPVERTTNDQSNEDIRKKESKEGNNVKKSNTRAKALDFSAWPQMPSDQVLADYKKLRSAKKASFTQTVVNSIGKELRELSLSNISADQALAVCCERGWQGLKAEWVINHLNKNTGSVSGTRDQQRQQMIESRNRELGILPKQNTDNDFIDGKVIGYE